MTVSEYTRSLIDQGLPQKEIYRLVVEFKKNNPVDENVEEVKEDVEVKQNDSQTEDPSSESNDNTGSESEDGYSPFGGVGANVSLSAFENAERLNTIAEDPTGLTGLTLDELNKRLEPEIERQKQEAAYTALTQVAKPNETYTKGGYEYKYSFTPSGPGYYARKKGSEEWIEADAISEEAKITIPAIFKHNNVDLSKYTKANKVIASIDKNLVGKLEKEAGQITSDAEKTDPRFAAVEQMYNEEVKLTPEEILESSEKAQEFYNNSEIDEIVYKAVAPQVPAVPKKTGRKINCAGPGGAEYDGCKDWVGGRDAAIAEIASEQRVPVADVNLEDPEVQEAIKQKMIANKQDEIEDKLEQRKMTNFIDTIPSDFSAEKLGKWLVKYYPMSTSRWMQAKDVWSRGELQVQMEQYQKDKTIKLDTKQKKIGDFITKSKVALDTLSQSYKAITEGEYQTPDQVANANKALENIHAQRNQIFDLLKEKNKEFNSSIEEKGDAEAYIGKLERNYSLIPILINNAENSALDMFQGVEKLTFEVANLPNVIEEATGINFGAFNPVWQLAGKYIVNGWKEKRKDVNAKIDAYQEQLMSDIAESMSIDDLETGADWGRYLFATTGAIAPQLAVMVGTGGYGVGIVTAQAGGNKFNQYEAEMEQSKKAIAEWEKQKPKKQEGDSEEFYQDQLRQWQEAKPEEIHYNALQMWGGAMTSMGAEFAGSRLIALPMINRAKAYRGFGVKPGFTKEFAKKFLTSSYGYVGDLVTEGTEEVFAEAAGNLYDRYVLGKDVNIFDGWKDNFFSGVMMANGFKAPGLFAPYINSTQTPGDASNIKGLQDKNKSIINSILQNPKMSKKTAELLQNDIAENTAKIQNIMQTAMNRYSDMSRDEITQLGNIEQQTFQIDQQIEAVKNDKGIEVGKEKLLDDLQNKKQNLTGEKNKILEPYVKKDAEGQIVGGGDLVSPKARVQEGAEVVAEQLGDVGINRFDTTEDIVGAFETLKEQGIKLDVAKNDAGEILDAKDQGYGLIATLPDGTQQVIINNASSEADGVLPADKHEILHAFAARMDPAKLAQMGRDLKTKLDSDPNIKVDAETQSLLNEYEADLKAGKINEATFYEEVMAVTSDALTQGGITVTQPGKLKTFLNNFLEIIGWKQSFKDGDQVIDFLKSFNKDVMGGKGLSQQTLDTAGVTLDTQTEVDSDAVKTSKKKQQDVDNAAGPKDDAGNYTVTKAEWDAGKADQAIGDLFGNNTLQGLIESKIPPPSQQPPGFSKDDFVQATVTELIPHIRNFNPEVNNSLSGWINSQLSNKIGNVFKKGEAGTKDVFEADVTEARGVVAETETEVETQAPRRKRSPKGDAVYSSVLTENLGTDVAPAIETAIQTDLKTTPVANMAGTRNIGPALGRTLGKAFGINSKVFTDKRQNIQKKDLKGLVNLKQYLNNNAQQDFKNLPDAYDSSGKSTFIPNNILNALYVKDGKGKWKLDPSKTVADYKALLGDITSDKPIYRAAEAQTIKGLAGLSFRNKMFETAFPEAVDRVGTGVKFSRKRGTKIREGARESLRSRGIRPIDNTPEGISTLVNDLSLIAKAAPAGAIFEITKPTNLAPAGNSSRTAKGKGALDLKHPMVSDVSKTRNKGTEIQDTKSDVEKGLLADLSVVNQGLVEQGYNKKDLLKDDRRILNAAIGGQSGPAKVVNNQSNKNTIAKGKDYFWKKIYIPSIKLNPRVEAVWEAILGNPSANQGAGKNLATINHNATPNKGKGYEEHWFQTGRWNEARTIAGADTSPGGRLENYINFSNKNYYQEIIPHSVRDIVDGVGVKGDYKVKMPDGEVVNWKSKTDLHPRAEQALDKALETNKKEDWERADKLMDLRKYPGDGVYVDNNGKQMFLNPFLHGRNGVSDAVRYGIIVSKADQKNPNIQHAVSSLINEIIVGKIDSKTAQERIDAYETTARDEVKSSKKNNKTFGDKVNPDSTIENQIKDLGNYDKAAELGRSLNTPTKGISVFDFDDTLAKTKEKVIVNMPNGETKSISASEFARQAAVLEKGGATFDFTNFEKVAAGTAKGPLADLALKRQDKFGSKDIFVLTARPQISASAIKTFLDGIGLNLPLANITGLSDGTPGAKGRWVASKAAEGYNDFYFADDAVKNVKAVKEVLDQIDVKSDVQIAKQSKKKNFDKIFNDILESSTGIETFKEYSKAKAQTVGRKKGRFSFFTTPSAEDFLGLLYKTLGKGKVGNAQLDFYKKNLLDTYDRAELATTRAKVQAAADFKKLKGNLTTLPKSLNKEMGYGGFTHSQAARVAVWTRQGMTIPGLSKTDLKALNDFVDKNAEMNTLVDELMKIQKGKEYPAPGANWLAGTITTDVLNGITKVNRKEYLQEWQENVDIIFSDKNMNKLEAAYGPKYVEALRDQLRRMKSGSNRPIGGSRVVNNVLDWLNNSVGAIMFLNTRSAVLQTLSAVNFIGVGNNGIINSAKAFANQKQYWKDFKTLMNSPYLVERRNGLKINVSESEIADAVAESQDKPKAALSYLLNKGFILTRFADSFAIATGGAAFYRNQLDMYIEQGMSQDLAQKQAFEDFYAIAEKNQQSSNPSKISQQQASGAGRVILAFANTPMQYARIIKRSTQDLIKGRGDWKKNVGTIAFYGIIQNVMFNALQNAVFAQAFGEDEEEDKKKEDKAGRIANGMADSLLAGLGIQGKAALALKNSLITLAKEANKESPKFVKAVYDLFDFSPPLDSKFRKLRVAANTFTWDRKLMKEKGFSLDNPAYLAGAQVISGLTNLPLDRAIQKINNIRAIMSEQSQNWQKVALSLGWSTWDVGLGYYGGFDEPEPLTEQQQYDLDVSNMKKETTTKEQKQMLLDLGVSKQEIKKLRYEEDRVKKIIELQKKKKDGK